MALRQLQSKLAWRIEAARTWLAVAGLDRRYHKIFAIGLNKTGTSSIDTLFEKLGVGRTLHGTQWRPAEAAGLIRGWRAFTDGPPEDFRLLDRTFPRSKFILNTRDLVEWLDSRFQHVKLREEAGLLKPDARYWRPTEEAVERWVRRRDAYHLDVMGYFADRPDDLLIVNFIRDPEAGEKIARFLGREPVAGKPYTRSTKKTREHGGLVDGETITGVLDLLGIPEGEWRNDLYCPGLSGACAFPPDTSAL